MKNIVCITVGFVTAMVCGACSRSTMSERDIRREQKVAAAEVKRQELQFIAGTYRGKFLQANGIEQNVVLKIEIKDIPASSEGSVDPVMTPTLTGYLRFNFGSGSATDTEYIGFAVQKADFYPGQNKLDLVVTNADYKDILITAYLNEPRLTGTWTAPTAAVSGDLNLSRVVDEQKLPLSDQLNGEYGSILPYDDKALYQYSEMTITTTVTPPEGMHLAATLKIIEFPLRGRSFQSERSGTLAADMLGEVGKFQVVK